MRNVAEDQMDGCLRVSLHWNVMLEAEPHKLLLYSQVSFNFSTERVWYFNVMTLRFRDSHIILRLLHLLYQENRQSQVNWACRNERYDIWQILIWSCTSVTWYQNLSAAACYAVFSWDFLSLHMKFISNSYAKCSIKQVNINQNSLNINKMAL